MPITKIAQKSAANAENYFSDDPANPLTEHGRQQAQALGARWADSAVHTDAIFASHMSRARDTAVAIASSSSKPSPCPAASTNSPQTNGASTNGSSRTRTETPSVRIDKTLHERTYGALVCENALSELEIYRELRGTLNRVQPIRTYRPRGGGESYSDVAHRGVRFVLSVLQNPSLVSLRDYGCKDDKQLKAVDGPYDWRAAELGEVPEGMTHVVVVSHNIFLTLLFEALHQWGDVDWDTPVHNWRTAKEYSLPNCGWCVMHINTGGSRLVSLAGNMHAMNVVEDLFFL